MPRRTRCGVCGDALWVYPTPTSILRHTLEVEGKKEYDHRAAWPAPSEAEQRRIQEEKDAEYSPFVHRGQHPDNCPPCEEVLLQAVGLRHHPKDSLEDEEAV